MAKRSRIIEKYETVLDDISSKTLDKFIKEAKRRGLQYVYDEKLTLTSFTEEEMLRLCVLASQMSIGVHTFTKFKTIKTNKFTSSC